MRLDTILSVAMGLSAIQSTFVYGFSSSSYLNGEPKSTIISKSCHKHCLPLLPKSFLFTNNKSITIQRQYWNSRIRQAQLSSKIGNDDDVIDAIVEEKTAGLALDDDEENTSVRYDQISLLSILYLSLFMFLHECFTYGVSIRVSIIIGKSTKTRHIQEYIT